MTRSLWCVAVSVGLVLGLASAVEAAAAPRLLPGDTVATEIRAARDSWIVGARPGRAAASVASRYGAVPLGGGAYVVKRERATALAGAFGRRGLLAYAEPDRLAHTVQAPPPDPLSSLATWRDMVVPPTLAPPRVTRRSPLLAIVDSAVDLSHPEFRGGKVSTLRAARVTFSSGTADASVAGAPANGIGILGIWPGMRVVNSPLPGSGFATCSQVTRRLRQAIGADAAVILMVYGFTDVSGPPGAACFSQYVALQTAVRKGIVLIGPTGFRVPGTGGGERRDEPASLPHVVTVAAVDAERRPALFSVPSRAVDLAAPGVDVLAAVPPQLDRDGTVDGYRAIRGTGVAAAMVAAAAAWLLAVDPSLTPEQVAEKLRKSAQDLDVPGHDTVTGSGLLNVGSALTVDPPARDRNEPNEDILWVNGRHLRPAQRPVWSGGRPRTIRTRLNPFEDPADVYVVRVPARWSIRVKVKPRGPTDLVLAAYDVPARTVTQRRHRLGRSQSLGAGTESLLLRNATPRARTLYLHTYINRGETTGQGNVPYSLTIAGSPTGR